MRTEEKINGRSRRSEAKRKADGSLGQIISRIEGLINTSKSIDVPRVDNNGLICSWDSSCERAYGYTSAEVLGKRLKDMLQSEHEAERFEKNLRQILDARRSPAQDKPDSLKSDSATASSKGEERNKMLVFEKTIAAISSRFVSENNLNLAIMDSLRDMGTAAGACRARLFLLRENTAILDNTHQWCADGINPYLGEMKSLQEEMFPWVMGQLTKGQTIHIDDVSMLPAEADAEKKLWQSQTVKSLVILPVQIAGVLGGAISLKSTSRTGQWPEEDMMLLRICTEIIGSALNRKRDHENLEKSREWFKAIADYTCDLESWLSGDGRLLWVNPAVERLTGYTVRECMNMPDYPLPFVYEDDRNDIAGTLRNGVERQTSEENLPFRIVRKDNIVRWVEISWQPVYNQAKSYVGIRTSIRDVTMEKLSEEALQESEERYRSLINDVLDSSAVGICIVDASCNVVWANSALERYLGVNRGNIIGKDSRELIKNEIKNIFDDSEAFASKVLASYQNNTYSERFECHVAQGPCRQERWLEHRSMPIRSGLYKGGRIEHYYDITIRKHFEENLHHSQRMLQLVLDSIPVRVFWKDRKSQFLGCNQAFVKDTGLKSPDEVIGKTDEDLFVKKDEADFLRQCDERVIKSGNPEYRIVQRHFRQDGTEAWLEANRIPLRDANGKIAGILGTYEDVTDRKLAEEEIQRLNRELEERVSQRTMELTRAHQHLLREVKERKALEKEILEISETEKRMIGQELHDSIGQQLMGTSFLTKVLEGRLAEKLPEEAASAKAISDLVNQTMDQARALARGLHPVDLDGGSLNSAMQELLATMERLFPVNCSLKIDNAIVVDDTAVAVNLYRITQEAITNAIKHGKARNINVELANSSDRAFLVVKNDGRSFPDTPSGTGGMGLRLMDHRAEMIGGSLNIRRNIGGGTVVTCCFPNSRYKC